MRKSRMLWSISVLAFVGDLTLPSSSSSSLTTPPFDDGIRFEVSGDTDPRSSPAPPAGPPLLPAEIFWQRLPDTKVANLPARLKL